MLALDPAFAPPRCHRPFMNPCAFSVLRTCLLLALSGGACVAAADAAASPTLEQRVRALARTAPAINRNVLALATRALSCARSRSMVGETKVMGIIDYSLPSTKPRLWVFDLHGNRLLYEELVAHGRNTGENMATRFSNIEGSNMSSLGAFQTQESYVGSNGYSLRLRGLERGVNDQARNRAIVIHGAPYVSTKLIASQGRIGRSLGCPALRPAVARPLIDTIRDGAFLFAYYPDKRWLDASPLLDGDCGARAAR